jgi:hypothetical protein
MKYDTNVWEIFSVTEELTRRRRREESGSGNQK